MPAAATQAEPDRTAPTVALTGMIGAIASLGGLTWVALNQLFGLLASGCDAHLIDPVTCSQLRPPGTSLANSDNAAYFCSVVDRYQLKANATLLCVDTNETIGLTYQQLVDRAQRTDALINVAGNLTDPALTAPVPVRAYVDLDPGFTQLWAAQGADMRLDGHTHFVTVGPLLGTARCPVPTLGRTWIPTVPPVSLAHWDNTSRSETIEQQPFTTVASWRGYGSVWHNGVHYGQKAHAARSLFALTGRTREKLRLALEIHPDERPDLEAFAAHSWDLVDPADVAGTPQAFESFVQDSKGEFAVAKLGYIEGRTGWFSDRSACYLAAGRPVIAHNTGFGAYLPIGEGLLAFDDLDGAAASIEAVAGNYPMHCRAARAIAEEHFAADRVMGGLLENLGVM